MALTFWPSVSHAPLAKWQRGKIVLCALIAVQAFTTANKVNGRATRVLQDATSPEKRGRNVILAPLKPLVLREVASAPHASWEKFNQLIQTCVFGVLRGHTLLSRENIYPKNATRALRVGFAVVDPCVCLDAGTGRLGMKAKMLGVWELTVRLSLLDVATRMLALASW